MLSWVWAQPGEPVIDPEIGSEQSAIPRLQGNASRRNRAHGCGPRPEEISLLYQKGRDIKKEGTPGLSGSDRAIDDFTSKGTKERQY